MLLKWTGHVSLLAAGAALLAGGHVSGVAPQGSVPLNDPPVFRSKDHQLRLVLIARTGRARFGDLDRPVWVYEVCERQANETSCAGHSTAVAPYGGVRLQLEPGDRLRIALVNQLPPAPPDAEHAAEMDGTLRGNPTNLHTHGMIVEPRRATQQRPSYGDYVFVLGFNSANGPLPPSMPGMDVVKDVVEYEIDVPIGHPAGLFWFHPHAHGLSLNQVTAGMAGVITVGAPSDYLCDRPGCAPQDFAPPTRYLTLKDTQYFADGSLFTQQNSGFCDPAPAAARKGACPGAGPYRGGSWYFTVNGQQYPALTVHAGGELWRITNASGSVSYELGLADAATGRDLPVQVVALDGVSVETDNAPGGTEEDKHEQLERKMKLAACPAGARAGDRPLGPICATRIRMMPSSRVELWVPSGSGATRAIWRNYGVDTGPSGDQWPAVDLAQVTLPGTDEPAAPRLLHVRRNGTNLMALREQLEIGPAEKELSSTGASGSGAGHGAHQGMIHPGSVAETACRALPPGHRRRLFLGVPERDPDAFGLGYEEIDAKGTPVPGTFQPVEPFSHARINLCLPLGPNNTPAREVWQLVNVASEDHNFHMHQTKFRVLSRTGRGAGGSGPLPGVLEDNVPVRNGGASCDGTVGNWRAGNCPVEPVEVEIPFVELGDSVYHCHILEHEDGGMMARIRVVPYDAMPRMPLSTKLRRSSEAVRH